MPLRQMVKSLGRHLNPVAALAALPVAVVEDIIAVIGQYRNQPRYHGSTNMLREVDTSSTPRTKPLSSRAQRIGTSLQLAALSKYHQLSRMRPRLSLQQRVRRRHS